HRNIDEQAQLVTHRVGSGAEIIGLGVTLHRLLELLTRVVETAARLRDLRERLLLELGGFLDRAHEARDQVVSTHQLGLDVRTVLLRQLIELLDPVVAASAEGEQQRQQNEGTLRPRHSLKASTYAAVRSAA